jgi:hypothetical protein
MFRSGSSTFRKYLVVAATAVLAAACAEEAPLAPELEVPAAEQARGTSAADQMAIASIRRATAAYHDLDAAIADGFVLLHPCEVRPDEGPVGIVYVHFGRVLDGIIDPELPDALIYEPSSNGKPKLVGAELVLLFGDWTDMDPPQFLGAEFQPEEEFGVWGLHVWAWRHNPEGMFAKTNPNVSCAAG